MRWPQHPAPVALVQATFLGGVAAAAPPVVVHPALERRERVHRTTCPGAADAVDVTDRDDVHRAVARLHGWILVVVGALLGREVERGGEADQRGHAPGDALEVHQHEELLGDAETRVVVREHDRTEVLLGASLVDRLDTELRASRRVRGGRARAVGEAWRGAGDRTGAPPDARATALEQGRRGEVPRRVRDVVGSRRDSRWRRAVARGRCGSGGAGRAEQRDHHGRAGREPAEPPGRVLPRAAARAASGRLGTRAHPASIAGAAGPVTAPAHGAARFLVVSAADCSVMVWSAGTNRSPRRMAIRDAKPSAALGASRQRSVALLGRAPFRVRSAPD